MGDQTGKMPDRTSDGRSILGPEAMAHLKVRPTGICWWCRERPATTGEHKFKRTDLIDLMNGGDTLLWGDDAGKTREIRGKSGVTRDRYGVVKFPKSMCEPCNNRKSKPFDTAYEVYSRAVRGQLSLRTGVDFQQIFGPYWEEPTLDVARFYCKHFGCRMVADGVPVPHSLREFLDGATNMPDAHMVLVATDAVISRHGAGDSFSPNVVAADKTLSRFVRYVFVKYVGALGVRYEWRALDDPNWQRSQFFHHPHPAINHFADELAVHEGRTRESRRRLPPPGLPPRKT